MVRYVTLLLTLAGGLLSGCVSLGSMAMTAPALQSLDDYPLDGSVEVDPELSKVSQELRLREVRHTLAETQCGSRIAVYRGVRGEQKFSGTLLKKSRHEIEIVNCIHREPVPGPDDRQQMQTSHVPIRSFKTTELVRVDVLDPPPADYVAPNLEECWDEMMVAKIIYRSGRPTTLYPMTIPKGHTLDPEHPPEPGSVRFYGDPE